MYNLRFNKFILIIGRDALTHFESKHILIYMYIHKHRVSEIKFWVDLMESKINVFRSSVVSPSLKGCMVYLF